MGLRDLVSISRLHDFWGIIRELDPDSIKGDAYQPLKIVVCGASGVGTRAFAGELTTGNLESEIVDVYEMPVDVPVALPSADLYLYVASSSDQSGPIQRDHIRQLLKRSGQVVCVLPDGEDTSTERRYALKEATAARLGLASDTIISTGSLTRMSIAEELAPALFAVIPELALAIGRRLPLLRVAAADRLVRDTARVNAEFAAVSSIPGFIPIVGGLAVAGADMLVLTKNQVMLVLKLAILHERPIDDRLQVLTEIAPVVGAGFLWRTAARSLVSLLPPPFAIAPNVAIAYVGTYVVGKAAQHYYRVGQRPSPELIDRFRHEATSQVVALSPLIARLTRRLPLL